MCCRICYFPARFSINSTRVSQLLNCPNPAVFDLQAHEPFKGNMDWHAVQQQIARDPGSIALICIELGNNASGGSPVSTRHLKDLKTLIAPYSIPLVLDATRVLENAQLLIERDEEHAGKSMSKVAREILSYADVVIGSLSKDFGVSKGGIIASGDAILFRRCEEIANLEGAGIDLIDKKSDCCRNAESETVRNQGTAQN